MAYLTAQIYLLTDWTVSCDKCRLLLTLQSVSLCEGKRAMGPGVIEAESVCVCLFTSVHEMNKERETNKSAECLWRICNFSKRARASRTDRSDVFLRFALHHSASSCTCTPLLCSPTQSRSSSLSDGWCWGLFCQHYIKALPLWWRVRLGAVNVDQIRYSATHLAFQCEEGGTE